MSERFRPNSEEEISKEKSLKGKVVLITGASRGIGAATALKFAQEGAIVIGPHRDPNIEKRVDSIKAEAQNFGGKIDIPVVDLTNQESLTNFINNVKDEYGKIDIIIHNAAGGLEKDAPEDYPGKINNKAKVDLTEGLFDVLTQDALIIDVSSLWSLYWGTGIEGLPDYDVIAESKKAGEVALRESIQILNSASNKNIRFANVCAHAVDKTFTVSLFKMKYREDIKRLQSQADGGQLPSIDAVAQKIVDTAKSDFTGEALEFVGVPTLSTEQIKERLSMYGDNALFVDRLVSIGDNHAVGYSNINDRFASPLFNPDEVDTLSMSGFGMSWMKISERNTEGHFKPEIGLSLWPGYQHIAVISETFLDSVGGRALKKLNKVEFKIPLFPGDEIETPAGMRSKSNLSQSNILGDGEVVIQNQNATTIGEIQASDSLIGNVDFQARSLEVAAQTLGLIFVEQATDKSLVPLFHGIESVEFFGIDPNFKNKTLEIEAKTTNIDDKGFQGDATIRLERRVIAEIKGLDCGIVNLESAPRLIKYARRHLNK